MDLIPTRHIGLVSGERIDPALANEAAKPAKPEKPEEDSREVERKRKLVEQGHQHAKLSAAAFDAQIRRELEDLEFDRALPEDQWPESIRKDRAGVKGPDGSVTNAKPWLTIPKLDQPCEQVLAEARNARLALAVKPKGKDGNKEGAEVRQGMLRAIQQESQAGLHRLWALNRAIKCGRGFYRVSKKWSSDSDPVLAMQVDLAVDEILNQHMVFPDPFCKYPDGQDSEFTLIATDLPEDEYSRRYPHSELAGASAERISQAGASAPGWIGADGKKSIRVAEYYYVEYTKRIVADLPGKGPTFLDTLPADMQGIWMGAVEKRSVKFRELQKRDVKWAIINATEVLDEEDWEGRWIPVVPVIGKRYNVNGDLCFKGIISNAKDAQRSYNYMRSEQVVAIGLATKAQWVLAEGQDEGYELMWDNANTTNYTRMIYRPTTFEGHLVGPPQRSVPEPAIQAVTLAVQMANQDIQATTGRFDPSLGRGQSANQSGRAIDALKVQGEAGSSTYLENLATISMPHEGRILLDMLKYVYDSVGRVVKLLGEENDDERFVMLNHPFVEGQKGEQPTPHVPESAPTSMLGGMRAKIAEKFGGGQQKKGKGRDPKFYDIKNGGDYGIEIVVQKAYATEREAESDVMGQILKAAPQMTPVLADLWLELNDSPVSQRAAKRLRKMNPQLQDEEDDGNPEIPPKVQAQLQALEQQHEQLVKALEETTKQLKDRTLEKQIEMDSKERIAMMQTQAQLTIAALKRAGEKDLAAFEAESQKFQALIDGMNERLIQRSDQQHEAAMGHADAEHQAQQAGIDRAHERALAASDQQHQVAAAGADAAHEVGLSDQEHQQQLEQIKAGNQFEPPPEGTEG